MRKTWTVAVVLLIMAGSAHGAKAGADAGVQIAIDARTHYSEKVVASLNLLSGDGPGKCRGIGKVV